MFRPDPKPVKKAKKDLHDFAKAMFKLSKRKPIRKVSKKTSKKLVEYSRLKKQFIVGKICPIYPELKVVDVHHKCGRSGDLLLDTRFWLAVSRKGHIWIELHPKEAREKGYSLPRHFVN